MRLDTKQLRHLATIVEERTFLRAATVLNVSQPALSKSIQLLERTIGVKLLERGRHGAEPTIYGKALALRYKQIEGELHQAVQDVAAMKEGTEGHLTIGATHTASSYIVPVAVSRLKAARPNIVVEVVEDRANRLLQTLKDGEIDLAVSPIYGEFIDPTLNEDFLFNSNLVVVTRPGHPLGKRKSVKFSDLEPYAYVGARAGNTASRQAELLLKTACISGFRYAVATNSSDMTKRIIEELDYFGLLPHSHVAADVRARLLHAIKLDAAGNVWPIGVRWRKDRISNPMIKIFISELKLAARRLKM